MATVIFYEKPGCGGNARQKLALTTAGHQVEARSLLAAPWTPESLRPFFGTQPVASWFNLAAPKVKSGEVDPHHYDETRALELLCREPLLIRRPLLQVGTEQRCGFDPAAIDAWIGLSGGEETDPGICRKADHAPGGCANPEAA